MNHKACQKNLILFLEAELNEKQRLQMENHLQQCSLCRSIAKKVQNVYRLGTVEQRVKVSPYLYTRVQARWQSRQTNKHKLTYFLPKLQPFATVIFVLIAVLCGYFLGNLPQPMEQNQAISPEQVVWQTFSMDVFELNPPQSLGQAMMAAFEKQIEALP